MALKAVHLLLVFFAASVAVAQYEYSYDYSVRGLGGGAAEGPDHLDLTGSWGGPTCLEVCQCCA